MPKLTSDPLFHLRPSASITSNATHRFYHHCANFHYGHGGEQMEYKPPMLPSKAPINLLPLSFEKLIDYHRCTLANRWKLVEANPMSRGAPKPATMGRSKPASAVTHIPHPFDSMQLPVELSALNQDA